jgi:hypothetical protein
MRGRLRLPSVNLAPILGNKWVKWRLKIGACNKQLVDNSEMNVQLGRVPMAWMVGCHPLRWAHVCVS